MLPPFSQHLFDAARPSAPSARRLRELVEKYFVEPEPETPAD
jgi:hypothetical protein